LPEFPGRREYRDFWVKGAGRRKNAGVNFASARQVSLPTLNFLIGVFTASYRILDIMQQATSPQTAGAVVGGARVVGRGL
jgi:hypothetical protein